MGVNSLPKTVTRQRRDCDLNPGPSAPESSTLITRLPISGERGQMSGGEARDAARVGRASRAGRDRSPMHSRRQRLLNRPELERQRQTERVLYRRRPIIRR